MDTNDPNNLVSDGACVDRRTLRAAKMMKAALSRQQGHKVSSLMVKIRKIPTGPEFESEIDSAKKTCQYPNATMETEEAQLILDGSEMASKTGAMFE